jgi:TnpA family transposase
VGERSLVLWHVETNAVCIYSQLKSFSNFEIAAMIGGLALVDVSNEYEEAMNNRSLLGLIAADISLGAVLTS